MEEMRNAYNILIEIVDIRLLEKHRLRWDYNMQVD
jgi:hypothetical protein